MSNLASNFRVMPWVRKVNQESGAHSCFQHVLLEETASELRPEPWEGTNRMTAHPHRTDRGLPTLSEAWDEGKSDVALTRTRSQSAFKEKPAKSPWELRVVSGKGHDRRKRYCSWEHEKEKLLRREEGSEGMRWLLKGGRPWVMGSGDWRGQAGTDAQLHNDDDHFLWFWVCFFKAKLSVPA